MTTALVHRRLVHVMIRANTDSNRHLLTRRFASALPSWSGTTELDDISNNGSSFSRLFNPTDDHTALRQMVRSFVTREVEPQALAHNRTETFNASLFRKFGTNDPDGLGILGLTVPEMYGGTGLSDATAVSIVHEELSYSDPALCLSYLAHSILLVNNLAVNGNKEQVSSFSVQIWKGEMNDCHTRYPLIHSYLFSVPVLVAVCSTQPFFQEHATEQRLEACVCQSPMLAQMYSV
jgi:isovaleryl-CoA dehydrogenase